jgi:hypothetical protein
VSEVEKNGFQWNKLVHGGMLMRSFPNVLLQNHFHQKSAIIYFGGVGAI